MVNQKSSNEWLRVFAHLVHPRARVNSDTLLHHSVFIASRLVASIIGLAAFPFCIGFWGIPNTADALALSFSLIPLCAAVMLMRTARFDLAQILSSAGAVGVLAALAFSSGGLSSFILGWLIVVLMDAAISGSSRAFISSLLMVCALSVGLSMMQMAEILPPAQPVLFAPLVLFALAVTLLGSGFFMAYGFSQLKQEQELLKNKRVDRYQLIAEHASDVIALHTRNGNLLFATPALKNLIGIEAEQATTEDVFSRVHVQDRPAYLHALTCAASEPSSVEFRLRKQLDVEEWLWIEMRCARLGNDLQPPQIVSVMRDITERKMQEQNIALASEESRRASASKTRFLANVSHELRTPLNAIIGFSEMMMQPELMPGSEKRTQEYAGLIHDSGKHLLDVVNAILDMSKIEAGAFAITCEPFQPAELIDNCVSLMQGEATKAKLKLVPEILQPIPDIVADRRACKQILINLLSNALKFTPEGGVVTVGLRADEQTITFFVHDTGVGISPEDLRVIAEPFVQAESGHNRKYEGTGLGLSLVKGLAQLHGGTLHISSNLGKGTTVNVVLPRIAKPAQPVTPLHAVKSTEKQN